MPDEPQRDDLAAIVASLERRAVELWGARRAKALASVIEETARRVRRVSLSELDSQEEPEFYPQ